MQRSLLFTRSKHPALDLPIRAFEGGSASHVGIRIGDTVVHSAFSTGGVVLDTLDEFLRKRELIQEIQLDLPQYADDWLYAQLGKGYDPMGIVGFLLWRDSSDPGRWYCSELAWAYLEKCGLKLADRPGRMLVRLVREIAHAREQALAGKL